MRKLEVLFFTIVAMLAVGCGERIVTTNNGVTRVRYEEDFYYSESPSTPTYWYANDGIAVPGSGADTLGAHLTNHWFTYRTQEDGLEIIEKYNLPAIEEGQ